MIVPVISLENEKIEEIELPAVFRAPIRYDIIKKAVLALQSTRFQYQGRDPMAGKRTTAESKGTGHGMARVPRLRQGNRAAFGVSIVGGHIAFPPKSEKKIIKRINKKEKKLAVKSSIAATADKNIVIKRGHKIDEDITLPIVIEEELEEIQKTQDVVNFFKTLGIWNDILRSKNRKIRAGKGKMRGRKKKMGKGPLIVINEDKGIAKAARNIPGVDIAKVKSLNAELLSPGTHPGRLVIWSKSAFLSLDKIWGE
jgi:large subunit ribosomal protein L4e